MRLGSRHFRFRQCGTAVLLSAVSGGVIGRLSVFLPASYHLEDTLYHHTNFLVRSSTLRSPVHRSSRTDSCVRLKTPQFAIYTSYSYFSLRFTSNFLSSLAPLYITSLHLLQHQKYLD